MIYIKYLKDRRLWVILTAAVVKMGYFGFAYYPLLDDYIQYGLYPNFPAPFRDAYLRIGLYAARPLAGLFDIYLWGRLWPIMGLAFFIITVLHALSAYLFLLTAEKLRLRLGLFFALFYILCPIGFEGSYWISASSRIIVGLFFVSLSCWSLSRGREGLFFLFQILGMLLYEQVAVAGFVLSGLILWRQGGGRGVLLLGANVVIFLTYYAVFSSMGRFSHRVSLAPFSAEALGGIARGWGMVSLYARGFPRGMGTVSVWYLIPIGIVSYLAGYLEESAPFSPKVFWAGIGVFALSYAPILALSYNAAALRTALVPLLGLAMALDSLSGFLRVGKGVLLCLVCFVFLVVNVSELSDYRENYLADRRVVETVAKGLVAGEKNAVTGAKPYHVPNNGEYAEHILSIASSDWALTGALRERLGDPSLPMIAINPEDAKGLHIIPLP